METIPAALSAGFLAERYLVQQASEVRHMQKSFKKDDLEPLCPAGFRREELREEEINRRQTPPAPHSVPGLCWQTVGRGPEKSCGDKGLSCVEDENSGTNEKGRRWGRW